MNVPIKILPYQHEWVQAYEQEFEELRRAFFGENIFFYHIGSTSIPGCCAKPIIDILAVVSDVTRIEAFTKNLERQQYEALGEYGMKQRRYFRKPGRVHLHIFEDSDPEVERHLRFCKYLRLHPEEVQTYSQLKQELAQKFPSDINQYCLGKECYIKRIDIWAAKTIFDKQHVPKASPRKKTWSHQEILRAMCVNMHLQMTYFTKYTPSWEIVFEPDVTAVRAQICDDTFNYVLSAQFSSANAQKRIREICSLYKTTPFSWWTGPLDRPSNLEKLLLKEGFSFKEDNVGMYLNLSSFTSKTPDNLSFVQVVTPDLLKDFCSIFVEIGGNPQSYHKIYNQIPPSLYQEGCCLEMHLAYVQGVPAVTGMLVMHAGTAGIYYIMTHPDMRRQGYGTAMTQYLLQRAQNRGYFLATLQASEEGKSLYQRLGFHEACIFREYIPCHP